jgi:L-aspartate oxidase
VDDEGNRFVYKLSEAGELATRDLVSRAIHNVMQERGIANVWLDLKPIGASVAERFPSIVMRCRQLGIDPLSEPIPVCPAAHYFMGGIWTDENGKSSLPGLYAIGECASTGLHGANRLASNSLLEAGVMAMKLSMDISSNYMEADGNGQTNQSVTSFVMPADLNQYRDDLYKKVGIERSETGLMRFLENPGLDSVPNNRQTVEAANIFLLGQLIARSALWRQESRGAHYRSDYPRLDDVNFSRRLFLNYHKSESMQSPKIGPISHPVELLSV